MHTAYEEVDKMSRTNDYTTGNLLDFVYFKDHYRLIAIHFSQETKFKDAQRINFTGKLEGESYGATILFAIEKSEETTFEFS